jgi:hypothetical protein
MTSRPSIVDYSVIPRVTSYESIVCQIVLRCFVGLRDLHLYWPCLVFLFSCPNTSSSESLSEAQLSTDVQAGPCKRVGYDTRRLSAIHLTSGVLSADAAETLRLLLLFLATINAAIRELRQHFYCLL